MPKRDQYRQSTGRGRTIKRKIMFDKKIALQQIDDIHKIVQSNCKTLLLGSQMIAVGAIITAIPVIELGLRFLVDPFLIQISPSYAGPLIFLFRTIFYWNL